MRETGARVELEKKLQAKLIASGWQDAVRERCTAIVDERGVDNVTVEELVEAVTPFARAMVAPGAKAELIAELREFIARLKL